MTNYFEDDPDVQEERRRIAAEHQAYMTRVEHDDFKWLASHKQGRRIIYRLLSRTGVFRNPFNPDAATMALNCGMMSIGQAIWADLHDLTPERYEQMVTEYKEHESRKPEHRGKS